MSRSLTSWSSHWMVISVPLQDTVAARDRDAAAQATAAGGGGC
jgi:hypothetical protein